MLRALQHAYPLQGNVEIKIQIGLTAPGRSACGQTVEHYRGLVVVEDLRFGEQLQPLRGVGGFPRAAGRGKQVRRVIEHHGACMEHEAAARDKLIIEALGGGYYFAVVLGEGGVVRLQGGDIRAVGHGYIGLARKFPAVFFRAGGHGGVAEVAFCL